MTQLIPVVNLTSGIITDVSPETLTLDVPVDLDERAAGVSLDRSGLIHYPRADGMPQTRGAISKRLAERQSGEACLVCSPESGVDGEGRQVYLLSVLEN